MRTDLLELAALLADPDRRARAATGLAEALGAQAMLIFVRDQELGVMLPAQGFPQTLPDGRAWRALVDGAIANGTERAVLSVGRDDPPRPCVAFAAGPDAAFVLVGGGGTVDAAWFHALMPLVARALSADQVAAIARAQERMAAEAAARASALARTLDQARQQLERALHEAQDREAALRHAREDAERANRAKSDFLATMSHELRTPLNAIQGYVELLDLGLHGPVTPQQREALHRIDQSQRRLQGLVNEVLNLSRIEAGRMDYDITTVVVQDVLGEIAGMVEPQLRSKGVSHDLHSAECRFAVRADVSKLHQILLNLLSNAVKFTPAGGHVHVECEPEPDRGTVAIRVADTGIGIPADMVQAIFEPFIQVSISHSRIGHGVGLGLAISRDLARGMGGDLSVVSQVGKGSTFTLTLPAAEARPVLGADAIRVREARSHTTTRA